MGLNMIAFLRLLIILPLFMLICISGCLLGLARPFHRNNTQVVASWFSTLAPLLGIKLLNRVKPEAQYRPKVIIGNHQSTYDLFTISAAVTEGTVSIGKKSIRWLPFFGQLYWLTGNILIDRNNKDSAKNTIAQVTERIHKNRLSVWMFPEGTRSRGAGLLNFKMGAFNTAIAAKVPIMPIVLSTTTHFKLNRFNNGYAIVEMLEPISTSAYTSKEAKVLANICHQLMQEKIAALDSEVAVLNKA
jgi:1-acyl-sn-glycerol-3-phosphate acyltransferase